MYELLIPHQSKCACRSRTPGLMAALTRQCLFIEPLSHKHIYYEHVAPSRSIFMGIKHTLDATSALTQFYAFADSKMSRRRCE